MKHIIILLTLLFVVAPAQSEFEHGQSSKSFIGLGFGDIDVTPIVLGADFRFVIDEGFFDRYDMKVLAGVLYWSDSDGPLDFSVTEVSSGIERTMEVGDYFFNYGARVGIASVRASVAVNTGFGTFSASETDTSLFISPFGEMLFPINDKMAIGAEARLPLYLGTDIDPFDIFYLLGSFNYVY